MRGESGVKRFSWPPARRGMETIPLLDSVRDCEPIAQAAVDGRARRRPANVQDQLVVLSRLGHGGPQIFGRGGRRVLCRLAERVRGGPEPQGAEKGHHEAVALARVLRNGK